MITAERQFDAWRKRRQFRSIGVHKPVKQSRTAAG
jgi:hypothetical protein